MNRLIIRHCGQHGGLRFAVQSPGSDGLKSAPAVELSDPATLAIEDTDYTLGPELAWYLEKYLDYPFGPNRQRAERTIERLRGWGSQAFETLFGTGQARDFYRDATRRSHLDLHLSIVSDDARILAWPWEALHDRRVGDLAHHSGIERQLDSIGEPPPLHPSLSRRRISILLITARPYEDDVAFRSISRPLIELVRERSLPVEIKLLRPPTLDQLEAELREHPGVYHIVHFDGHGGFGHWTGTPGQRPGAQGHLIFETEDGGADPIPGPRLSQLLRTHRIPIAVLNACQSAMHGPGAEDAFASVATSLLDAGIRSVLAMSYSLYVHAAKVFLPAFYERLFESGSMEEATRAGRNALRADPQRRPGFALEDWLVPVLYQQDPLKLDFAAKAEPAAPVETVEIPVEARLEPALAPTGLIGRDSAVLAMERASRRKPAGILVHGLAGIGKTTLVHGFLEWLSATQGLSYPPLWISFVGIRSADQVLNRMVEHFLDERLMPAPADDKWAILCRLLRQTPAWIVWDNFDSASGAAEVGPDSAMSDTDLERVRAWLEQLHNGKAKVLITSRSEESRLGTLACSRLSLNCLHGEDRQAFAEAILAERGVTHDPFDRAAADLIESLAGHPLMMRMVLPRLATHSAAALRHELSRFGPQAEIDDPLARRLYATLRFVEEGVPAALRPLLYAVGLHEGHVSADCLGWIAAGAGRPFSADEVLRMLSLLESAGLAQAEGGEFFRLHPALTWFLRSRGPALLERSDAEASWIESFIDVMASVADTTPPMSLQHQRTMFAWFGGSFAHARSLAKAGRLSPSDYGTLTQALAAHAEKRHHVESAQAHFEELARHWEEQQHPEGAAAAYHQLGNIALMRSDLPAARQWYQKSLQLKDALPNESSKAITYHQLGMVAQLQHELDAAEQWYRKALAIHEERNEERFAAGNYGQLGTVAMMRGRFAEAEQWLLKSAEKCRRNEMWDNVAIAYHQLGRLKQEQGEFGSAAGWFHKSLELNVKLGDDRRIATSCHELGCLAQIRKDFDGAEEWYLRALEILENLGIEGAASTSYHQLGILAFDKKDFVAAEEWLLKALEIRMRLKDEAEASSTLVMLGVLSLHKGDLHSAKEYLTSSLEIGERLHLKSALLARHYLEALAELAGRTDWPMSSQ